MDIFRKDDMELPTYATFSRGDYIIDVKQDVHGIIVESNHLTIKIKWMKRPDQPFVKSEGILTKLYVRKKIIGGYYIHKEKQ